MGWSISKLYQKILFVEFWINICEKCLHKVVYFSFKNVSNKCQRSFLDPFWTHLLVFLLYFCKGLDISWTDFMFWKTFVSRFLIGFDTFLCFDWLWWMDMTYSCCRMAGAFLQAGSIGLQAVGWSPIFQSINQTILKHHDWLQSWIYQSFNLFQSSNLCKISGKSRKIAEFWDFW